MPDNTLKVLNAQFPCPRCNAPGAWQRTARPAVRQNSTIHRLRCARCNEHIVAKASHANSAGGRTQALLRQEHQTLAALQAEFPQDEGYGTLIPLGYLDAGGRGILVTELAKGRDLTHYVHTLDAAALEVALKRTGTWLRKLHTAGIDGLSSKSLEVDEKIDDLERTYGAVLRSHEGSRRACELLVRTAPSVAVSVAPPVRLHGDFKPQNVLYNGTRCVGLDIHWRIAAASAYDLAPFLNHLWLTSRTWRSGWRNRYSLAERAFLAGYGDTINLPAVRWAQLYFALCHLGNYRQRGMLAAGYARWAIWPLVKNVAVALQQGT